MSLSDLIKGTSPVTTSATVTLATLATYKQERGGSVATVTSVNVAIPEAVDSVGDTLSANSERLIRNWLHEIGETDQLLIDKTIHYCRADIRSRDFFLAQAKQSRVEAAKKAEG
jgi:hypothetical protein